MTNFFDPYAEEKKHSIIHCPGEPGEERKTLNCLVSAIEVFDDAMLDIVLLALDPSAKLHAKQIGRGTFELDGKKANAALSVLVARDGFILTVKWCGWRFCGFVGGAK